MAKKVNNVNHELIVYNSNDPSLYHVTTCDGCTLSRKKYEEMQKKCGLGPYICFFKESEPSLVLQMFRFRGMYEAFSPYYAIDALDLRIDDQVSEIIRRLNQEK